MALVREEERWAKEKTPNHQGVEDSSHSVPLKGGPTGFQSGSTILPQRECCPLKMWLDVPVVVGVLFCHPSREAESEAPGESQAGRLPSRDSAHTPAPHPRITICWAVFLFIKATLSPSNQSIYSLGKPTGAQLV